MKYSKSVLWLVILVAKAFGSAPSVIPGEVYYEVGATVVNANYSVALELFADGTYVNLFEITSTQILSPRDGIAFPQRLTATPRAAGPRDGTWSFRKLDGDRAELAFSSNFLGTRVLTFSGSSGGSIQGVGGTRTGEFKFVIPGVRQALVNCSNRSFVSAGRSALSGFVLTEPINRVLVRAIGPGLRVFNVPAAIAAPTVRVQSDKGIFMENTGWNVDAGESIRRTSAYVGAFPLSEASDSAVIVTLPPGQYTAEARSSNTSDSGDVLVEIYLLP